MQDRRPGVYRANIQICNHLCPAYVYTYRIVIGGKGAVRHSSSKKKKKRKAFFAWAVQLVSSMSWHRGTEYKTVYRNTLEMIHSSPLKTQTETLCEL